MIRYAHLDSFDLVIGVYQLSGEVDRQDYIMSDVAEIGDLYSRDEGTFSKGGEK